MLARQSTAVRLGVIVRLRGLRPLRGRCPAGPGEGAHGFRRPGTQRLRLRRALVVISNFRLHQILGGTMDVDGKSGNCLPAPLGPLRTR